MDFIVFAILSLIAVLWGAKIAIETPEEMHLRSIIFNIFRLINFVIILVILAYAEDIFMVLIAFFLYIIILIEEDLLKHPLSFHKENSFYRLFRYGNFLFLTTAIMFYFYFVNLDAFYIIGILMLIELILLGILESYYEIKKSHPKQKFTTETTFPMKFTFKTYATIMLRYLPLVIVMILLEFLLKIKL